MQYQLRVLGDTYLTAPSMESAVLKAALLYVNEEACEVTIRTPDGREHHMDSDELYAAARELGLVP